MQYAWPPWLQVAQTSPDLAIVAVLSLGMVRGPMVGCVAGLFAAYLAASTSSLPVGNLFISHMGVGLAAGLLHRGFFSTGMTVAFIAALAASTVVSIISLVLVPPAQPEPWFFAMIVRALYTAVFCIVVHAIVKGINARFPQHGEDY